MTPPLEGTCGGMEPYYELTDGAIVFNRTTGRYEHG